MSSPPQSVTFVVQEGMESTVFDKRHHPSADELVRQTFQMINPDFVLHVGDDMHLTTIGELQTAICDERTSVLSSLPEGQSLSVRVAGHGIRFIRINAIESEPPSPSAHQKTWLTDQLVIAQEREEQLVVLHDSHPTRASEDLSATAIEGWRELMATERPVVVLCGHSHYWRLNNDGLQVSLATRSAGNKPIRGAGFLVGHLEGDHFAAIYRTADECGPAVMITHPRDQLLSIGPQVSVSADDTIRVRIWSIAPLIRVVGILNQELSLELRYAGDNLWTASLSEFPLGRGLHTLRVVADSSDGLSSDHEVHFRFDQECREVNLEILK